MTYSPSPHPSEDDNYYEEIGDDDDDTVIIPPPHPSDNVYPEGFPPSLSF